MDNKKSRNHVTLCNHPQNRDLFSIALFSQTILDKLPIRFDITKSVVFLLAIHKRGKTHPIGGCFVDASRVQRETKGKEREKQQVAHIPHGTSHDTHMVGVRDPGLLFGRVLARREFSISISLFLSRLRHSPNVDEEFLFCWLSSLTYSQQLRAHITSFTKSFCFI